MTTERNLEMCYEMPEFIAELRRLADALESGDQFEIDGEQVLVPDDTIFSIEHERDEESEEIEFKLKWDVLADQDEDEDGEEDSEEDAAEDGDEPESEKNDEPSPTPA